MDFSASLTCFFAFLFPVCFGLKITEMNVPQYVRPGENVTLECAVDTNGDKLYSLKWYKNTLEIYTYLPNKDTTRYFNVEGINFDKEQSDKGKIVLLDVNFNTSGMYRCEASSDKPHFHTKVELAPLTVYVSPENDPVIKNAYDYYSRGEKVRLDCSVGPSKPAPSIQWFINDREVENKNRSEKKLIILPNKKNEEIVKHKLVKDVTNDGLDQIFSSLEFTLSSSKFNNNKVVVACKANISTIYNGTSSIVLQISRTIADIDAGHNGVYRLENRLDGSNSGCGFVHELSWQMFIYISLFLAAVHNFTTLR